MSNWVLRIVIIKSIDTEDVANFKWMAMERVMDLEGQKIIA